MKKRKLTYAAYHYRVYRLRGQPKFCEDCKSTTRERYEWASVKGKYEDPYSYRRLCVPCHTKFDKGTFDYQDRWGYIRCPKRECLACGKLYKPTSFPQKFCGSKTKKKGCSYKNFIEYGRKKALKRYYDTRKLKK